MHLPEQTGEGDFPSPVFYILQEVLLEEAGNTEEAIPSRNRRHKPVPKL